MEIEVRAKIRNTETIEKNLKKLGAVLAEKVVQDDIYFGSTCLFDKIGYSFMMRVRDEGEKSFLTYKGARTKMDGVWEEYEFAIEDKKVAIQMLKAMGLEKIIRVKKTRKVYKLKGFSICVDNIRNLGNFIEIELISKKNRGKNRICKLMTDIGIEQNRIIHKGYITMMLKKNKSAYSRYILN
jgi:adenylate cyclase class 2